MKKRNKKSDAETFRIALFICSVQEGRQSLAGGFYKSFSG